MKKCSSCGRSYNDDILFCPSDGTKLDQYKAPMSPSIFPGQIFQNRYEIKECINGEGRWFVYRGYEVATKREIAVKISSAPLYNEASFHSIEKSLRNAQKVSHPGWIKILDFGKDQNDFIFIITEFVEGESLSNILDEVPKISPTLYYSIMKQLLPILHSAHQNNTYHQNLHPSKIILMKTVNSKQFIKVLGLGESNFLSEYDTNIQGNLVAEKQANNYTAPEIFLGKKVDATCDIYSAGIIFYQLITRVLPFPTGILVHEVRNRTPEPPPMKKVKPHLKVPTKLEKAIIKSIQWSTSKRYSNAKHFLYDIEVSEKSYVPVLVAGLFLLAMILFIILKPYFFNYIEKKYKYVKIDTMPVVEKEQQEIPAPSPEEIFEKKLEHLSKIDKKNYNYANMIEVNGKELKIEGEEEYLKPFYIDANEVTNEQYEIFLRETGYEPPSHWLEGKLSDSERKYPVVNVSWHDAALYAFWAGKRLPTEIEWEIAICFGSDEKNLWFWGNTFDSKYANVNSEKLKQIDDNSLRKTSKNIFDMSGNVWEWTDSWFDKNAKTDRVIRGGSFTSKLYQSSSEYREGFFPHAMRNDIGFRCVRDK